MTLSMKISAALVTGLLLMTNAAIAQDKPNILVIWGDDIGVHNVSAYNHGMDAEYRQPCQ